MRVNCRKALNAFLAGKSANPARSIWTNGHQLYSYNTCLATKLSDGRVILNRTRYSVTTSIHQNALAAYFGGSALRVDDVRLGADSVHLWEALGEREAAVCA